MSEFEMASLFYQVLGAAHAALANFPLVIFAVLVVSYFVAGKLDRLASSFLFDQMTAAALVNGFVQNRSEAGTERRPVKRYN
jgi:hypothetical protein